MTLLPVEAAEDRMREVERRLSQLRALVDARGARGAFLAARRNFAWATAGGQNHVVLASETGAVPLLVTRTEAVAIAPVNEAARVRQEELRGLPVEVAEIDWYRSAKREAERRAGGEVLSDDDLESDLASVRSVLPPFDQARMRWLGREIRGALDATLERVSAGTTEDEIAAEGTVELARRGVRAPVVLVAADERIERYRHPLPTSARVRGRAMLVLVAERWGLHVALTGFRELETPSPDLAARTAAVAEVLAALRDATRPGRSLGDAFDAAVRAYRRVGYPDEWRLHHQGGTIAYRGREHFAKPQDATVIEPGMAFAWNPSITGAKLEETFLLGPDGEPSVVTGG